MTVSEARRIALAAQGFAAARPARPGPAALRKVLERVQLVQIDSVNALVRAQELPLWARLGAHPRGLLPDAVGRRELFEYWGHEASLCPTVLHPLLRWRMAAAADGRGTWGSVAKIARDHRGLVDDVLAEIRSRGPLGAGELTGSTRPKDKTWWGWSDHKRAVEFLFWAGALTATRRPNTFERVYDLPERVIPSAVLAAPTPTPADAQRALLRRAATALGVATAGDLADYFRIRRPIARPLVAELVEAGALVAVTVDGWREPALLDPDAIAPRSVDATALLGPFDSLVWERDRTQRLFDFHYRLELYTPAPKRRFGYYVLPFLLGDRLVARVDLRADRAAAALAVHGAFAEAGVDRGAVAAALVAELHGLATWLGLDHVTIAARGDLARPLRAAARA